MERRGEETQVKKIRRNENRMGASRNRAGPEVIRTGQPIARQNRERMRQQRQTHGVKATRDTRNKMLENQKYSL